MSDYQIEGTPEVFISPVLPNDPAKVGDFWIDARLVSTTAGTAYVAHDSQALPVMLIMLSEGAASDLAARDRLAGMVNQLHIDTVVARGGQGQDEGRLASRYRAEDDDPTEPGSTPQSPWVALAYDGSPAALAEARRILAGISLSDLAPLGTPAGPDFALSWSGRRAPGVTRLWPLPWPGRHDRAGWLSILASWLLMLLLAALAILISILLFQNTSTEEPPPPVPTTGTDGTPQSQSPASGSPSGTPTEPQSGSPSPSSGSPSGSPSPSGSQSGSGSPSGSPSPSGSQSGSPSGSSSGSPQPSSSGSQSGSPSPSQSGGGGTESPHGSGSPSPNSRL